MPGFIAQVNSNLSGNFSHQASFNAIFPGSQPFDLTSAPVEVRAEMLAQQIHRQQDQVFIQKISSKFIKCLEKLLYGPQNLFLQIWSKNPSEANKSLQELAKKDKNLKLFSGKTPAEAVKQCIVEKEGDDLLASSTWQCVAKQIDALNVEFEKSKSNLSNVLEASRKVAICMSDPKATRDPNFKKLKKVIDSRDTEACRNPKLATIPCLTPICEQYRQEDLADEQDQRLYLKINQKLEKCENLGNVRRANSM